MLKSRMELAPPGKVYVHSFYPRKMSNRSLSFYPDPNITVHLCAGNGYLALQQNNPPISELAHRLYALGSSDPGYWVVRTEKKLHHCFQKPKLQVIRDHRPFAMTV
jgi:hypothetical protein